MRTKLLQSLGVLGIVSGGIAIWYAFQRQMCIMVGGGIDSCTPNLVYLIPGILAALVGISLLTVLYRRNQFDNPSDAGT